MDDYYVKFKRDIGPGCAVSTRLAREARLLLHITQRFT
jgi:hypothetical protein